jgi:hypothetical protein
MSNDTFKGRERYLGRYVMIRSTNAGVFAGTLDEDHPENNGVILTGARRIWMWAGAASLSELATRGPGKPKECKFPCEVDEIVIAGVIEIIPITDEARAKIAAVPVWSASK